MMLPSLRQRLIIAVGVVVGGLCWRLACGPLAAGDASSGLSLIDAESKFAAALALVLLAGFPAIVLGLIASASANPLAGVFVVAAALSVLAGAGGAIDGYLRRTTLPVGYGWLLGESLIWLAGLVGLLVLIEKLRDPLRRNLPFLASDDHYGAHTCMSLPKPKAWLSGALTAGVGGLVAHLLIQSSDSGQVIGSMLLAFTIGGLVGHLIVPQSNPVATLLSPIVVAGVVYAYVWLAYTAGDLWAAKNAGHLPGLALAMPIHYASVAVAGTAMGVGMAQGLDPARTPPKEP